MSRGRSQLAAADGYRHDEVLDQRTLDNGRPRRGVGAGAFDQADDSTFNNLAGGMLTISNSLTWANDQEISVFNNYGDFVKSSDTGTTAFNVPVNNIGNVQADAGTLAFASLIMNPTGQLSTQPAALISIAGNLLGQTQQAAQQCVARFRGLDCRQGCLAAATGIDERRPGQRLRGFRRQRAMARCNWTIRPTSLMDSSTITAVDLDGVVNADLQTYGSGTLYPTGGTTLNVGGVPFTLANYPGGRTGAIQLNGAPDQYIADSVDIPVNIADPSTVYTLINSFFGQAGFLDGALEFFGTGGAYAKFNLVQGTNIRDYDNDGLYDNDIASGTLPQPSAMAPFGSTAKSLSCPRISTTRP